MKTIRVIVCGSRYFNDYDLLKSSLLRVLGQVLDQVEIVSGTCRGADELGERFAHEFNLPLAQFRPDWNNLGNAAGPIRNGQMLDYALQANFPIVIAFSNGKTHGTKDMVNKALNAGVQTYQVFWELPPYDSKVGSITWFPAKFQPRYN